ncbi:MAG: 30S ribosomal protein S17 [Patescibacteria group bacterium]
MEQTKAKILRQLRGVVVSAKADKTRIVLVSRTKSHPRYGRQYKVSRRYAVHDEKNTYHEGDRVIIEETRPLSKTKKWRIVKKIS